MSTINNDLYNIYDAYKGVHNMFAPKKRIISEQLDDAISTNKINNINIYVKPSDGPIQLTYKANTLHYREQDNIVEITATVKGTDKKIHITHFNDNEIKVTALSSDGKIEEQFVGKNITFPDDDEPDELNILKIEEV
jgi:archaellin